MVRLLLTRLEANYSKPTDTFAVYPDIMFVKSPVVRIFFPVINL